MQLRSKGLFLILGLIAIPLLLEANTGCVLDGAGRAPVPDPPDTPPPSACADSEKNARGECPCPGAFDEPQFPDEVTGYCPCTTFAPAPIPPDVNGHCPVCGGPTAFPDADGVCPCPGGQIRDADTGVCICPEPFVLGPEDICAEPPGEGLPNAYSCGCTCEDSRGRTISVNPRGLRVCLPAELDPNVDPDRGSAPSDSALADDCAMRVATTLSRMATLCGYSEGCTCAFLPEPVPFDASCDTACTPEELVLGDADGCENFDPAPDDPEDRQKTATHAPTDEPVCLVAGSDPPVPTPDPLAAGIFGRQSTCEVSGVAGVDVGGEFKAVATEGIVTFVGNPCTDDCRVGVNFELDIGDLVFEDPRFWKPDPRFEDLAASGASEPNGLRLPFGDSGVLHPGRALTSAQGRRGSNRKAFVATNRQQIYFSADWEDHRCSINGDLVGGLADGEESATISMGVEAFGDIVNQPPDAAAGDDRDVECTSPEGALVSLAGSSGDPDDNVVMNRWLRGGRTGDLLDDEPAVSALQALGTTEKYVFRVIDAFGQSDEDDTLVSVVDSVPPLLVAPGGRSAECEGPEGTLVALGTPVASDLCDDSVEVTNDAPDRFPLGETVVTWMARDDSGRTSEATQIVTVEDTTDPVIQVALDPTQLWPPNHKLVDVHAAIQVADVCDPDPEIQLVSIASSETDDGRGDGHTTHDIQGAAFGTDDREFQLRAERSGRGTGRDYTVVYRAVDASGNDDSADASVRVNHDRRSR